MSNRRPDVYASRRRQERQKADLVKRGKVYVDAPTDLVYTPYARAIFGRGQAKPAFADQAPLIFYASADNELFFFEPASSRPWSEIVAAKGSA